MRSGRAWCHVPSFTKKTTDLADIVEKGEGYLLN